MKRTITTPLDGSELNRGALAMVVMLTLLSGCADVGLPFGQREATETAPRQQAQGTEVEAPEVFQLTAQSLWDGRPSLGGVWVAAPNVTDPERVVIRNADTGTEIVGALFRRERENPGPPIQVSADAAAALGLIAGQPARLSITALRRVEAPAAPAAAAVETTSEATASPAAAAAMLQVATLTSQAAADAVVARLQAEGLTAEVRQRQAGERTLYRVVTGPSEGPEARDALQARVRALGYADAFFLST